MNNLTFEERYLMGQFERGDSFSDDSGNVILCTKVIEGEPNDEYEFSLIEWDEEIDAVAMELLKDEDEYYTLPSRDLAEQYPTAEYEGNYLTGEFR
jgi:hypothetical protein